MSMYNLVFGRNPLSDAILATLGLTRTDCGRFRDCFVTNGEIAVYTRNGGGNRNCWRAGDPKYTIAILTNSAECACPGCIIKHRLPRHPCYLRDEDDDFDRTYATIYFKFPDGYAEELQKLDSGERFDPSQRWLDAIENLKGAKEIT